jgi:hypothetical protein
MNLANFAPVTEILSAPIAEDDGTAQKLGPATVKTVRIAMNWFIPTNYQRISSTFVPTAKQCGIHLIRLRGYNARIVIYRYSFLLEILIIHKIKNLLKCTSYELKKQTASRIPTANMTQRYVRSVEFQENLVATLYAVI